MKVGLIVAQRLLLSSFRISGDAKQLRLLVKLNGRNKGTVKDTSNINQFLINTNSTCNLAADDAKKRRPSKLTGKDRGTLDTSNNHLLFSIEFDAQTRISR
jgi:hypothetical protein